MKRIIDSMGGLEFFGILSLLLFVAVFSSAMIWAACLKKTFLRSMETLPLDDEQKDL